MKMAKHLKFDTGKYLELVYRYLSIRNRSEKEIRDYLTKKEATSEIREQIVALLKKQKFLNDELFARAWVSYRARTTPRGKHLLRIELKQKGIDKELIDTVLGEKNEELPDELTQARGIIKKRIERLRGQPKQEIYNKVGSFLARRGFDWDTAKKAIDQSLVAEEEASKV